ncbi:hypothetical protein C0993_002256, partial [Termitomyces sp. T159_Od127]
MSKKALKTLKAGLNHLKDQTKMRQDDIQHRLSQNESISTADEEWLDKEGNLINKERVIEALDNAPDYERGLEQLDSHQKALVDRLKELGEEARKVVAPGNKRK